MSERSYEHLGVMIDVSRNAVMTVDGVKRFLALLAKMGYNCAMLYTEDTYEIDGEPFFGYMRGRYTSSELREIDDFAASIGIEMIPCIQTLAHLSSFLRWGKVSGDCGDILLADDERTYELIDRMFQTVSSCFRSRNIHIGMDEAHMLGRGKHLDRYGYEDTLTVFARHLDRVCKIAAKYGYESPMLWSDMFFRPWNNHQYYIPKAQFPQDILDIMPKCVTPVYWDYYHSDESAYDDMISNHRQISDKMWFAGATGGYMVPRNRVALDRILPALRSCKKNGVRDILITMWGDNGAESGYFSSLPSLFYIAQYACGNTDEELIKQNFERLVGISYDDFLTLDLPNELPSKEFAPTPSRYMLYSDYFNDFLDHTVMPGGGRIYEDYAARLGAVAKKTRKFGYIFNYEAKLCSALAIKYELGLKTRTAYENSDKAELERLAREEYPEVIKRIRAFHAAFERHWFHDNKPCGFDVQDMRIGAILQRTESCRRRILKYVAGDIKSIQELDERLLPLDSPQGEAIICNKYSFYSTPNIITEQQ